MENIDQILDAPAQNEGKFEYAGFWMRTAAALIDGILLSIVSIPLRYLLLSSSVAPLNFFVSTILGALYYSFMESSDNQATLGKMAVGIKVGDANGNQLTFGNALGRHFAKYLSFIILLLGFIMVAWDEKKQGLHDKLAQTYVFYK